VVPAEQVEAGMVPAEQVDTGMVPAEQVDTGMVPAEQVETGMVPSRNKRCVRAQHNTVEDGNITTSHPSRGGGCCFYKGHIVTALNSRITGQSDRNYRARGSKVWWWMERELEASKKGGLFYSLLRTGEGGQWLCLPIG